MWDCERCGCQSIFPELRICPHCHQPRNVPVAPATVEESAEVGDGTQLPPVQQAPQQGKKEEAKTNAKS